MQVFFSSSSLSSGWAVSGAGGECKKGPPPPASGLMCLWSEQGTSQSRAVPKGLLDTQDVEAESVSAFGCVQNTDGFISTWVPSTGRLGAGIPACGEVRWHSGTSTPTWPGWRGQLRCRSVYIVFVHGPPSVQMARGCVTSGWPDGRMRMLSCVFGAERGAWMQFEGSATCCGDSGGCLCLSLPGAWWHQAVPMAVRTQLPACLTPGADGLVALTGWWGDAPCVSSVCTQALGHMWLEYICLHILQPHTQHLQKQNP